MDDIERSLENAKRLLSKHSLLVNDVTASSGTQPKPKVVKVLGNRKTMKRVLDDSLDMEPSSQLYSSAMDSLTNLTHDLKKRVQAPRMKPPPSRQPRILDHPSAAELEEIREAVHNSKTNKPSTSAILAARIAKERSDMVIAAQLQSGNAAAEITSSAKREVDFFDQLKVDRLQKMIRSSLKKKKAEQEDMQKREELLRQEKEQRKLQDSVSAKELQMRAAIRVKAKKEKDERLKRARQAAAAAAEAAKIAREAERVERFQFETKKRLQLQMAAAKAKEAEQKERMQRLSEQVAEQTAAEEERLEAARKASALRVRELEMLKLDDLIAEEEKNVCLEEAALQAVEDKIAELESTIPDKTMRLAECSRIDSVASSVKAASFSHNFSELPFDSDNDCEEGSKLPYVKHVRKTLVNTKLPVWKQSPIRIPGKEYYLSQFKRN